MAMETETETKTDPEKEEIPGVGIFRFCKVNDVNGDGDGYRMGNGTKIETDKENAQAFYVFVICVPTAFFHSCNLHGNYRIHKRKR